VPQSARQPTHKQPLLLSPRLCLSSSGLLLPRGALLSPVAALLGSVPALLLRLLRVAHVPKRVERDRPLIGKRNFNSNHRRNTQTRYRAISVSGILALAATSAGQRNAAPMAAATTALNAATLTQPMLPILGRKGPVDFGVFVVLATYTRPLEQRSPAGDGGAFLYLVRSAAIALLGIMMGK
jgi:hypothetical protein